MGVYGNSWMTITFPEGCPALWEMFKFEIENLNKIDDLEIEWDEDDLSVCFRTTGEKVCWAEDGGPITTLMKWSAGFRHCPLTQPLERVLKAELATYSSEFVLDEFDEEKVLMWCDYDLDEDDFNLFDFACDSDLVYDHDLATQVYCWDGKGGWPNKLPEEDYNDLIDDFHRKLVREIEATISQ